MQKVASLLESKGVEELITVDPHTTEMFREIFPRYIGGFKVRVRHYLEVLAERAGEISFNVRTGLPSEMVMHDSCVMTRGLDILAPARTIARKAGIEIIDSENSGYDTACCGGPVEYAFPEISLRISESRVQELSSHSRDVLVMCPICLINLAKHESARSIRVWDMACPHLMKMALNHIFYLLDRWLEIFDAQDLFL
jgi:Fe-S oxidoreductase